MTKRSQSRQAVLCTQCGHSLEINTEALKQQAKSRVLDLVRAESLGEWKASERHALAKRQAAIIRLKKADMARLKTRLERQREEARSRGRREKTRLERQKEERRRLARLWYAKSTRK